MLPNLSMCSTRPFGQTSSTYQPDQSGIGRIVALGNRCLMVVFRLTADDRSAPPVKTAPPGVQIKTSVECAGRQRPPSVLRMSHLRTDHRVRENLTKHVRKIRIGRQDRARPEYPMTVC
jgi:hypothetical protein